MYQVKLSHQDLTELLVALNTSNLTQRQKRVTAKLERNMLAQGTVRKKLSHAKVLKGRRK